MSERDGLLPCWGRALQEHCVPARRGCGTGPLIRSLSVETLLLPPSEGQSVPGTESHPPGLAEKHWHTSGTWEAGYLLSVDSGPVQVSPQWGPGTLFTLEMRMGLLVPVPLRSPVPRQCCQWVVEDQKQRERLCTFPCTHRPTCCSPPAAVTPCFTLNPRTAGGAPAHPSLISDLLLSAGRLGHTLWSPWIRIVSSPHCSHEALGQVLPLSGCP